MVTHKNKSMESTQKLYTRLPNHRLSSQFHQWLFSLSTVKGVLISLSTVKGVLTAFVIASVYIVSIHGPHIGKSFLANFAGVKSNPSRPRRGSGRRNLIMMVSDGFGPTSETFGRTMYQYFNPNLTQNTASDAWRPGTPLDPLLVGTSRTRSSSSLVTDSAAGATAFSCAQKTYNGAISVMDDMQPCATVFEAAKLSGYKTGKNMVLVSHIIAHVPWRDYENDIAEQQIGDLPVIGRSADLLFGGGRRHFVPHDHPESAREDQRDLLAEAEHRGFTVLTTRSDFDNFQHSLPVLGVFTPDHMSYNIDRDPLKEPSLKEMTERALPLLYNASLSDPDSPGFFIMIEGSRIDMAAHSNDPGTHSGEILHYYEVIQAVRDFIDLCPDKTVMVSTSDHETGGLSLARQNSEKYPEYLWNPDAVAHQRKSTVKLAAELVITWLQANTDSDRRTILLDLVSQNLNITDMTNDEISKFIAASPTNTDEMDIPLNITDISNDNVLTLLPTSTNSLDLMLATLVSIRAELGWATHGHSGVDVNLYAYGHNSKSLSGNLDNTQVGLFLQQYLGVQHQLAALTSVLQRELKFKHPRPPPPKNGPSV